MAPGGTYQVDVRRWDNGRYLLVDAGGSIRLTTFSEITARRATRGARASLSWAPARRR